MGSSKKKSSFRIDDILQHQQQSELESNLMYSNMDNFKTYKTGVNTNNDSDQLKNLPNHGPSTTPTSSSDTITSSSSSALHFPTSSVQDVPRKPMPMYPQSMLDFQKQNFCFPLTMGMPTFSPAAAYLEHYANAFHKGN